MKYNSYTDWLFMDESELHQPIDMLGVFCKESPYSTIEDIQAYSEAFANAISSKEVRAPLDVNAQRLAYEIYADLTLLHQWVQNGRTKHTISAMMGHYQRDVLDKIATDGKLARETSADNAGRFVMQLRTNHDSILQNLESEIDRADLHCADEAQDRFLREALVPKIKTLHATLTAELEKQIAQLPDSYGAKCKKGQIPADAKEGIVGRIGARGAKLAIQSATVQAVVPSNGTNVIRGNFGRSDN